LGNKGLKAQIYKGMMVEKVTYTVLKTSNNLEIRKYSKLLLAVVEGFLISILLLVFKTVYVTFSTIIPLYI
jgi:hypothetical protein